MIQSYMIVGAKFRPPARALLDTLAMGITLIARREPSNAYDPNAIQVLVQSADIRPSEDIAKACSDYGKSMEEILAAPEWHLGYIPREHAAALAPLMDGECIAAIFGHLGFSAQGVPVIRMEVPNGHSSHNAAS